MTPLPTHVSHSTLVAHYSFDDGTAADDYGSLDGTIHGATATTGQYGIGGALSFDGTDDYVEFPSAVTADILGSAARTVCLWAVIDAFDVGSLFSYGSDGDRMEFGILSASASGTVQVQMYGSHDTDVALAGSDDGDWHHYCLAYDGSAWTVYFDGASAQTVTVAIDTGSNYALTLGDRTDRNGNHAFSGSIDEVYVYASALDAEQVLALSGMSMPPSAAPSPSPTAAPSSLPSAEPSPEPTATFIEITGVGDEYDRLNSIAFPGRRGASPSAAPPSGIGAWLSRASGGPPSRSACACVGSGSGARPGTGARPWPPWRCPCHRHRSCPCRGRPFLCQT